MPRFSDFFCLLPTPLTVHRNSNPTQFGKNHKCAQTKHNRYANLWGQVVKVLILSNPERHGNKIKPRPPRYDICSVPFQLQFKRTPRDMGLRTCARIVCVFLRTYIYVLCFELHTLPPGHSLTFSHRPVLHKGTPFWISAKHFGPKGCPWSRKSRVFHNEPKGCVKKCQLLTHKKNG